MKNCYTEDVLKAFSRHVMKTYSRRLGDQPIFAERAVLVFAETARKRAFVLQYYQSNNSLFDRHCDHNLVYIKCIVLFMKQVIIYQQIIFNKYYKLSSILISSMKPTILDQIWSKIKKSIKVRHEQKTLMSAFTKSLTSIVKVLKERTVD